MVHKWFNKCQGITISMNVLTHMYAFLVSYSLHHKGTTVEQVEFALVERLICLSKVEHLKFVFLFSPLYIDKK